MGNISKMRSRMVREAAGKGVDLEFCSMCLILFLGMVFMVVVL